MAQKHAPTLLTLAHVVGSSTDTVGWFWRLGKTLDSSGYQCMVSTMRHLWIHQLQQASMPAGTSSMLVALCLHGAAALISRAPSALEEERIANLPSLGEHGSEVPGDECIVKQIPGVQAMRLGLAITVCVLWKALLGKSSLQSRTSLTLSIPVSTSR